MVAASEISTDKDNVAEASNTSMCAMSGDKNKANAIVGVCNTIFHNANERVLSWVLVYKVQTFKFLAF